jgi:hypothetical protein
MESARCTKAHPGEQLNEELKLGPSLSSRSLLLPTRAYRMKKLCNQQLSLYAHSLVTRCVI